MSPVVSFLSPKMRCATAWRPTALPLSAPTTYLWDFVPSVSPSLQQALSTGVGSCISHIKKEKEIKSPPLTPYSHAATTPFLCSPSQWNLLKCLLTVTASTSSTSSSQFSPRPTSAGFRHLDTCWGRIQRAFPALLVLSLSAEVNRVYCFLPPPGYSHSGSHSLWFSRSGCLLPDTFTKSASFFWPLCVSDLGFVLWPLLFHILTHSLSLLQCYAFKYHLYAPCTNYVGNLALPHGC